MVASGSWLTTGACFAQIVDHGILHRLEEALQAVWIFGQIFLFSMLGSKITPDLLPELGNLLPLMLCGLLWRLLGVALGILITSGSRGRPTTYFVLLPVHPSTGNNSRCIRTEAKESTFFHRCDFQLHLHRCPVVYPVLLRDWDDCAAYFWAKVVGVVA
eukprot:Skav225451  [mRNA]  locus=scaffold3785:26583:27059:- [translate_table: standard]